MRDPDAVLRLFKINGKNFSRFGIELFHAFRIEIQFGVERFEPFNIDIIEEPCRFSVKIAVESACDMNVFCLNFRFAEAFGGSAFDDNRDRIGKAHCFAHHFFGSGEPADLLEKRKIVGKFPVDIEMRIKVVLHTEHGSALTDELGKQMRLSGREIHQFGKKYEAVTLFSDHEAPVLHGAVLFHKGFVAVVVVQMSGFEQTAGRFKGIGIEHEMIVRFRSSIVENVCGGDSVHQEHIGADFPFGEENADPGERVIERTVIVPPRLMDKERGGIVAFTDSAQGIAFEVLAEQIDPVYGLPLIEPLEIGEIDRPSAERKRFGENLRFSRLGGGACQLQCGRNGDKMTAERIHAGNMIILVMRHDRAVAGELGAVIVFADLMAGELPAVRFAPVVNRFHEMIEEQMCREAPETPACAFPSAEPEEEVGENVKEFFPVCGTVFRLMSERPRDAVPGDLRFIGEKAFHAFAFGFREGVIVCLMNCFQEFFRDFEIESVDIIGIDVVIEQEDFRFLLRLFFREAFAVCGIKSDPVFRTGEFRRGEFPAAQVFLLILYSESVYRSASETAGPAVFIVCPWIHAAFTGRADGGFGHIEPLFAEITGEESAAGVHEESADSGIVHQTDLAGQFPGFQPVVPAPKRYRTVIPVRIRSKFSYRHNGSLCKNLLKFYE